MNRDTLWAPWRLGYVTGQQAAPPSAADAAWLPDADRDCFLCRAVAERRDRDNLLVARGPRTAVVLNRYPYNNGHLLIAPLRHAAGLDDLAPDEHLAALADLARAVRLLARTMSAEGFNVGLNLGRAAGAGVPGHLHWHVVPRWSGDTNFMPTLAGVKVIPQALDALWEFLSAAWATSGDDPPAPP